MAKRVFKIGERVWSPGIWGTVAYINGSKEFGEYPCGQDDSIIILGDNNALIDCDVSCVYQLAEGYLVGEYPCVWEHDDDVKYPLYCPDLDENFLMCKVIK